MSDYTFLGKINNPSELKSLSEHDIELLCSEIRHELVLRVLENGGHLASNLGIVELTIALHRVFDSPKDRIIWDVGHQSYVHKMITGRYNEFETLRQPGGLSGFTKICESEHDPFGAGHSSTSLSAAIGFAEADRINGRDNYTIAVIGDGAFTGGMAHEALNNCRPDLRLIIILNENEMSISKNIGGFAKYIAKIRASKKYYNAKRRARLAISDIPFAGKWLVKVIRRQKQVIKNLLYSSNLFEEMGIYYLGPVDGNDFMKTERLIREAKAAAQCTVIHVKTQKGRGYEPAEKNPNMYHGVPPKGSPSGETFSARFGRLLSEQADKDKKICAITAAMSYGTGLDYFKVNHPDRFFDVGIAEAHAATFAAGLAAAGMKPVFAVYSSFLQRSYDSLIHDIALQKLPVTVCIDRAGLSPQDGPTHHGIFDVAFLSGIPGVNIFAPLDFEGLEASLNEALCCNAPAFVRYPSGIPAKELEGRFRYVTGEIFFRYDFNNNCDCYIITYGRITAEALSAKKMLSEKNVSCGIIVLEALKPYDKTAKVVLSLLPEGNAEIIFLEEGIKNGGAGMSLYEELRDKPEMSGKTYKILAIDDNFAIQSKNENIYKTCGISADDIVSAFDYK